MINLLKNVRILLSIIIFLSAVLLYSGTFNHDYSLDDSIVITENIYTKQGISGIKDIFKNDSFTGFFKEKKNLVPGGRYRPLSIATFAIEYEIFGKNPGVSHLINVLLYALTGILIFVILSRLTVSDTDNIYAFTLPFVCAILFIFHPVHTEVVANIKGRDEILALLLCLAALSFTISYLNADKNKFLVLSGISFFLALLSKENAMIFILIMPLTVYFFTKATFSKFFYTTVPLLLSSLLFLIIRFKASGGFNVEPSGELMNNPFLHATDIQKYATIFYTLGIYVKLLLFPHPLTFDYYPYHIALVDFRNAWVFISMIVYCILIITAISGIKTKRMVSYGIWLYLLPLLLVSNLVFNVGTFMNERFVYFSSLGFCFIIAVIITYIIQNLLSKNIHRIIILLILLPVLTLYSLKTTGRNKAWKDDFTLFTTDVNVSSNSAKSNCSAGGALLEKAQSISDNAKRKELLDSSINYLNRAIKIHGDYADAYRLLGNAHYEQNRDIEKAIYYYKQVLLRNPFDEVTYNNIIHVLNNYDNINHKISILEDLYRINPNRFDICYNLGNLYGKYKNNLEKALFYLKKASVINPESKEVCKDLGVAYGLSGQLNESIKWLEKAILLEPADHTLYINLGITYQRMGNPEKAGECFLKAQNIKQKQQFGR
jgi:tetratricopeptide (TPR) repeat protein